MDMAALLANPKPVDEDEEAVTRICPLHGRRLNKVTLKCDYCAQYNKDNGGRRKAQPKREKWEEPIERYTYTGSFDPEHFAAYMKRVEADPVRYATAMLDARRPPKVDRFRFGVASRKQEPMLNANAKQVRDALGKAEPEMRKHPKEKIYRVVTVKPQQLGTARNAGSWKEQTWTVWTLKYTKGLIIVTESGIESCVYPGWGAMMQGILNNGWEIVR